MDASPSSSGSPPGSPPEPALTWLGHATTRIDLDGVSLLTDPLLRDRFGPVLRRVPPPDPSTWRDVHVVLISHLHHDHLDLPSLRAVGSDVPVVVPAGAAALLRSAGHRSVIEVAPGEVVSIGGVEVRATPARHSGFRPPFGPRSVALGYVLRGSASVYFAGDTALFPGMAALAEGDLDLALLPVGGWGPTLRGHHLDPVTAVEALRLIRPRAAVPVHWGTYWPRGLTRVRSWRFGRVGEDFARLAARHAAEVRVTVLRPGQRAPLAWLTRARREERFR